MKTYRYLLMALLISLGMTPIITLGQSPSLKEVEATQTQVGADLDALAIRIEPVLDQLVQLGASREDLDLVRQAFLELKQLSDEEVVAILEALQQAASDPGLARSSLESALTGQEKILQSLSRIFDQLRVRQQQMELAAKAEALRRRQAENRHQAQLTQDGRGDPVSVEAEQEAIGEAVEDLLREAEVMAEAAQQEGSEAQALDPETMEQLEALAEEANQALEDGEMNQAIAAQTQMEEILADIAAETGQEQASADFAESLVFRLRELVKRQEALAKESEASATVASAQERLGADTEAMLVLVENVNAPASYQVGAAADSMRQAYVKLSATPPTLAQAEQARAIEQLRKAIELLEQNIEAMEGNEQEQTPEEALAEMADIYHKAEELERRQEQLNQQGGGSPQEQAELARETAQLQEEVLEHSPEAARNLGRAATGMAEAMDQQTSPEERQDLREEAARQLGMAKQAVQSQGRAMRNDPPGQQGGGLTGMGEVALEDNVLAPAELTAEEREAITAARREPVSPEYAPLVEAYYDQLSQMATP